MQLLAKNKRKIDAVIRWGMKRKWLVGLFAIFLVSMLINAIHESFPDEYDNILGGFYINNWIMPNTGFFTHHNIGAYFLASINTFFTSRSFVLFRLMFAVEMWVAIIATYVLLRRGFGSKKSGFYLMYAAFLVLGSTYWWGQMFLSETIVSYLIIPVYALIVLKTYGKAGWRLWELGVVSVLLLLSFSVSLTYVYIFAVFYPLILVQYVMGLSKKKDFRRISLALLILGLPYAVFGLYLLITRSYEEFYYQQYYYNFNYYIYNFPDVAGERSTNPIRYGISIFYKTVNDFYKLLIQVKDFNLEYPFNVSLVLGNLLAVVYVLVRKKYLLAVIILATVVFANARSEPLNIKETDFHATLFIALTLFNISWSSFEAIRYLNGKNVTYVARVGLMVLMGIVWLYFSFSLLLLASKFGEKAYQKYMGAQPLIYDRPTVAPILNKITTKDDFIWVGPFAFHELLYVNGKNPSKYHWFLPQGEAFGRFKDGLIADLTVRRPKVIVFEKGYTTFGKRAEEWNYPMVDFLNKNYFGFEQLSSLGYVSKVNKTEHFDFTQTYFFDNTRREEIVNDLINSNLIEKSR